MLEYLHLAQVKNKICLLLKYRFGFVLVLGAVYVIGCCPYLRDSSQGLGPGRASGP